MGTKEDTQDFKEQVATAKAGLLTLKERLRNVGTMVGLVSKKPKAPKKIETLSGEVIDEALSSQENGRCTAQPP